MRVMVPVKATADSEAGTMPSTERLTAMGRFNETLADAGIMLAGEGALPDPMPGPSEIEIRPLYTRPPIPATP